MRAFDREVLPIAFNLPILGDRAVAPVVLCKHASHVVPALAFSDADASRRLYEAIVGLLADCSNTYDASALIARLVSLVRINDQLVTDRMKMLWSHSETGVVALLRLK